MKYTFACKRVPLNDSIKEYAQKKISKLERYFREEDTTAFVTQGEDDTRAAVSLRKAILRLFIYLNFILYEKMVYMVLTDGGSVRRFRLLGRR